ncbi:zinc finger protein ZAT5-like [Rhododendron vialii]|uniref:zinc finger protein ZAT5-like n=1 Tax=Rhododendron vialii TaxID=182163 RepID=UPI00265DB012|nr:zinc finger protein ZAT5-like [Rhododendron vialii]
MESPEEFTGSNDHSLIMKRKRTKRQRPSSASTSSTGAANSDGDGVYFAIPSPTSSGEMSITNTEEDQDMAKCLILLARGVFQSQLEEEEEEGKVGVKFNRHAERSGFCVYECKTCNRTFPSFQALGGHRASHKKPKTKLEENRAKPEQGERIEQGIKFTKLVSRTSDKPKMHECSICGSEFSSGQALGGHMRRHRAVPTATSIDTNTAESDEDGHDDKKRNVLPLDLNLPAPLELEDDDDHHGEINFQFDLSKQCLGLSGPALVDCHY